MELSSSTCAEICVPINWRRVTQGISVVAYRNSSYLSCMMGNRELFWSQCRGIGLNLEFIWANPRYFTFLRWHQCSSRLVRDFWGLSVLPTSKSNLLTCFIGNKELLCMQCRGIRPNLSESGKSDGFSRVEAGTWGISRVMAGVDIKNFCLFSDVRTPI